MAVLTTALLFSWMEHADKAVHTVPPGLLQYGTESAHPPATMVPIQTTVSANTPFLEHSLSSHS